MDSFKSSQRITARQDIVDFLRRPVVIVDGILQSSDNATVFTAYRVPDSILVAGTNQLKITGFIGIRGTYVYTLQVNANRFVQGRYMLNFYPSGGAVDQTQENQFRAFHEFSLMQRTQVPGVQIDLNTETQVTLKIPFVSPYLYNPIGSMTQGTGSRQIGVARIQPYVPASVNVGYTLWGHIEDAELFIPTVPQARGQFSHSEKEQKTKDIGPVESISRAISVSTQHFTNVPILGTYVTPVKWAADLVAGVAAAFGWSKPTISDTIQVFGRHRGFQNTNVDGADLGVKMCLSVKNEVVTIPGLAGTDIDEMSFDYIKTIPAYFSRVDWSGQAKEVLLATIPLNPTAFLNTFTDNGNNVFVYPPCSMPSTNFTSYRGGFKIKIKTVKTEFHSGRLSVVFVPKNTNGLSNPAVTFGLLPYTNRHVIDIRYGNEWEFTFPFTSEFTYLGTGTPYGTVYVYVDNVLTYPASVSSTVNLLFEVSGASDLEYAVPRPSPSIYVYRPTAPQSAAGQFNSESFSDNVGGTKEIPWNVDYCKASIGEKFTSYRQLLKKFDMRARKSAYGPNSCTFYLPFLVSYVEGAGSAGNPTLPICQPDTFSLVSIMFAISRGSTRVKFYDFQPGAQGSVFVFNDQLLIDTKVEFGTATTSFSGVNPGPALAIGGLACQVPVNDGLTGEVQNPMYSAALGYPVADVCSNPAAGGMFYRVANSSSPETITTLMKTNTANTTAAPYVLRAAGDDFSLHGFICTPPLINLAGGDTYVTVGWT